jgi:biotin-[acetyl-CoA-carboxylase] ligase BirA-like protein|tara:strand:+ start:240 stop:839 length:600 start_codon:yes stop_codon:yes gene_type:complete
LQLALKEIDLKTSWIKSGNKSFIYEEVIDSTLNIALNEHNQNNYIGQIVISDKQLDGKGTYNKSWYSEPYKDLTFSIILGSENNFQQDLIDGSCEAIINILKKRNIKGYQKKPNDIYVNNKKIAGVLLSNVQTKLNYPYQALSIGININSDFDLKKIDKNAKVNNTSFFKELQIETKREEVLVEILESIDGVIQRLVNQ